MAEIGLGLAILPLLTTTFRVFQWSSLASSQMEGYDKKTKNRTMSELAAKVLAQLEEELNSCVRTIYPPLATSRYGTIGNVKAKIQDRLGPDADEEDMDWKFLGEQHRYERREEYKYGPSAEHMEYSYYRPMGHRRCVRMEFSTDWGRPSGRPYACLNFDSHSRKEVLPGFLVVQPPGLTDPFDKLKYLLRYLQNRSFASSVQDLEENSHRQDHHPRIENISKELYLIPQSICSQNQSSIEKLLTNSILDVEWLTALNPSTLLPLLSHLGRKSYSVIKNKILSIQNFLVTSICTISCLPRVARRASYVEQPTNQPPEPPRITSDNCGKFSITSDIQSYCIGTPTGEYHQVFNSQAYQEAFYILRMATQLTIDQIYIDQTNEIPNLYKQFPGIEMSQYNEFFGATAPDYNSFLDFTSFEENCFTAPDQSQLPLSPSEKNIVNPTLQHKSKRSHQGTYKMMIIEKPSTLPSHQHPPTPVSGTASPNPSRHPSASPNQGLQQQDPQSDTSVPQPYVCEHCKSAFRFSRDYWQHKAQVHNDFRYRCKLGCGKGFARHDNLVQHHRESKRHRRSPSPAFEEDVRRKKARKSSVEVDLDELRYTSRASITSSPLTLSVGRGTPSDEVIPGGVSDDLKSHPEYLRLQMELKLLNAKYELMKKEVNTLREEKEEWQAMEYLRKQSERRL
ncbi:hypothetical protein ABW19_dt0209430 [Dactylella cylindrospora]|nr:hypothetical protein ABW19_dt0209430 [Dactylella cylindrospora]